jgi:hypothetical protein
MATRRSNREGWNSSHMTHRQHSLRSITDISIKYAESEILKLSPECKTKPTSGQNAKPRIPPMNCSMTTITINTSY